MPNTSDLTGIEPDDMTAGVPAPLKTKPKVSRALPPSVFAAKEAARKGLSRTPPTKLTDLTKIEPDDATAPTRKYAKGGYVRAADGIAQRGKTRGRMV